MKWMMKKTALLLLGALSTAHATVLVDEAHVVSASKALAGTVIPAATVTITTPGVYTLTLTDVYKDRPVGDPGEPFSSLSAVISKGSKLIKRVSLPATDKVTSDDVTLAAGVYQIQVIGMTPDVSQYIAELKNSDDASVWTESENITAPTVSFFSRVEEPLSVITGNSYTVTLSDRVFPVALADLQASIVQDGTTIVCPLTAVGATNSCNFVGSNSARLVVLANEASGSAGLYSVKVVNNTSGATVYTKTFPLGKMPEPVAVNFPATDSYSLSTVDFASPSPLTSLNVALVQDAELLVKQMAIGSPAAAFNANAGPGSLFVIATAQADSAGQYSALIKRGNATVISVVEAVADADSSGLEGYVFTTELPVAGNYSLQLRDFAFPQAFSALSASVSQGGVKLPGTLSTAGTLAISNAAAGQINIAILAKLATSNDPDFVPGGLFGISLAATGSSTPILEKTQGVGGSFVSIDVTLTSADRYSVGMTDFAAPTKLSQLRGAVTRGANVVGSIYAGGTFSLPATPGTYTLSYLATASSASGFGMYGASVATAPAITLSADSASVGSGATATLTWAANDADACTASGGWTGSKATSGTATVGPIAADTTYTLTCTGVGGSSAKSTTVTIQAAQTSSGGGGGGVFSLLLLAGLGLLGGWRQLARSR